MIHTGFLTVISLYQNPGMVNQYISTLLTLEQSPTTLALLGVCFDFCSAQKDNATIEKHRVSLNLFSIFSSSFWYLFVPWCSLCASFRARCWTCTWNLSSWARRNHSSTFWTKVLHYCVTCLTLSLRRRCSLPCRRRCSAARRTPCRVSCL